MNEKEDIQRLLEIVKEKALLRGEFTLVSGVKSSYYFDGRMVTLWPEGSHLLGKIIFDLIKDTGVEAIGGPTLGADPIVAAVTSRSYLEGKLIPAFIVRGELKEHGTQKRIEGPLPKGSKVAIVDDVITTGGSLFRAIKAAESEGCQVIKVITLLDRQQGGSEELRQGGYDFTAILSADPSGEIYINE